MSDAYMDNLVVVFSSCIGKAAGNHLKLHYMKSVRYGIVTKDYIHTQHDSQLPAVQWVAYRPVQRTDGG